MSDSPTTFKLVDMFLLTFVVSVILTLFVRHPIPAVVITLAILGVASFSIANRRLLTFYSRHRYAVLVLIVLLYALPWIFLSVGI